MKNYKIMKNKLRARLIIPTAFMAGFLLPALFVPRPATALSLGGDSKTYARSTEASDGTRMLGGYEYLDFAVRNIGTERISFHAGGWLRYDFKETELGKRSNSDLQYSYLRFAGKTGNTAVDLGRVMVFEGVAAERVDGLHARADLAAGFGISAFGGSPVETNIDLPGNSVIYGGRLSHQVGDIYQIGISALQEEKDSLDYRKEGGIDIWLHPFDKADVTGRSSYNDITRAWMEHSYGLMLGPFANLRFDSTASWIFYDDFFFRTTNRAFVPQQGRLEPGEKARILGEEVSFAVTDKVLLAADYRNFEYDIAGRADYYGGRVRYASSGSGGAGIGYHRMQGEADALKYDEYRVYAYKKIGGLEVTADVIDVVYDIPRNDVEDSYSGSLAAQYALSDSWKLGADVEYSRNPDFDKDIRAFFKALYHFGSRGGE